MRAFSPVITEAPMRLIFVLLLAFHALPLHAQPPPDARSAASAAAAAFINATANPRATLLPQMTTTALGCPLAQGLPLAEALDVWRFDFATLAGDFAVHTTVDGSLIQLCDQRVPNLGFGPIPLGRQNTAFIPDSDNCWLRALSDGLNVRVAPMADVAARLDRLQKRKALGRNEAGDWLFFRMGWVKRSMLQLNGSCDDLPIIDPAHAASGAIHFCPAGYAGFLPPRIDVGRRAARSASETFANRLRAHPDPSAELVAEIPPRQILDAVLDGPACQGAYVWWQVETDGQVGWTIESDRNANFYYLEPFARPSLHPVIPGLQRDLASRFGSGQFDHPAEQIDTIEAVEVMRPRGLAISPDGRLLAVGGVAGARLFKHLPYGSDSHPSPAWLPESIDALAWSNANDRLALINGRELQVWKLRNSRLRPAVFEFPHLDTGELMRSDRFPYPLRSAAFSQDDRWLAVTGMSASGRHGALWVYDRAGELALSLPLVGAGLPPVVVPSPQELPGDFAFSSADRLYFLSVEDAQSQAFYQLAGAQTRSLAFAHGSRNSALLALALETDGLGWVALVDALDADAPSRTIRLDAHDLAFDYRRQFLAATTSDRLFFLGTVE